MNYVGAYICVCDTTDSVQVNPEEMADQLQKSVILLGQTLNAMPMTYQRRLNVMSSLGDAKEARALLLDDKMTDALLFRGKGAVW